MALDSVHPLFETTDTFQQLIDHLNHYGDNVDSDLRWLDSQIGNVNLLTTENINDSVTKNLVSAINEIDSDLFGAGGGNFATDTLSKEKTILGAINSVFDVFDPDSAGFHFDSESFTIIVSGEGQSLSLISDSDINIIAAYDSNGGDVILSADDRIQFRHLGKERVHFQFRDSGGKDVNTLYSNGVYEMHSKDSVLVRSDANAFTFNNVVDWRLLANDVYSTVHGNLSQNIDGTYTISFVDGTVDNELTISRSNGENVQFQLTDTGTNFTSSQSLTIDAPDVTIDGATITHLTDTVRLESPTGGTYGGFTNEGGFLTIRSNNDSAFINLVTEGLNQRVTQFNGSVELPARPVDGSLSIDFDTIGSRKLHDVLEAINRKIPRVYDRNGRLLNELI
jgi:hypothetical protein